MLCHYLRCFFEVFLVFLRDECSESSSLELLPARRLDFFDGFASFFDFFVFFDLDFFVDFRRSGDESSESDSLSAVPLELDCERFFAAAVRRAERDRERLRSVARSGDGLRTRRGGLRVRRRSRLRDRRAGGFAVGLSTTAARCLGRSRLRERCARWSRLRERCRRSRLRDRCRSLLVDRRCSWLRGRCTRLRLSRLSRCEPLSRLRSIGLLCVWAGDCLSRVCRAGDGLRASRSPPPPCLCCACGFGANLPPPPPVPPFDCFKSPKFNRSPFCPSR